MKYLIVLLMLPLLISAAPAPAPIVRVPAVVRHVPAPIARQALRTVVLPRRAVTQPACTEQLARQTGAAYLHEVINDARGYPIGDVAAWSCSGDVAATIAEFQARKAALIGGAR